MTETKLVHPGDVFPALTVNLPTGRTLGLPDAMAAHFGVVLFCRGSWCPYCNAQLSAFQRSLHSLAEMDVMVVALSVDDEATTRELIAKNGLRFPVGHSAAAAIAEPTGAFVNPGPRYLREHAPASQSR
jgi:peroxiredoxin